MNKILYLLFGISLLLVSCGPAIEGNGVITSQNISVENYKSLSIKGVFSAEIKEGSSTNVKVIADENLLEYIKIEVINDELKIYTTEYISGSEDLQLFITYENLNNIDLSGAVELTSKTTIKTKRLSIDGSGAVELDLDIDVKELSLDMSGASETTLSGKANELFVDISGAGELDAISLYSKKASINISGAGEADVHVTDLLEVDITGAGSVNYKGSPEIDKHVTGAGNLNPL